MNRSRAPSTEKHTLVTNRSPSGCKDELEAVHMIFGDDMAELAALYTADGPKRITTLREAVATDDRARIAKVAHAFSGSCMSIGATGLCDLCRDLESSAWTIDADGLARKLDRIETEYERIRAKLRMTVGPGA